MTIDRALDWHQLQLKTEESTRHCMNKVDGKHQVINFPGLCIKIYASAYLFTCCVNERAPLACDSNLPLPVAEALQVALQPVGSLGAWQHPLMLTLQTEKTQASNERHPHAHTIRQYFQSGTHGIRRGWIANSQEGLERMGCWAVISNKEDLIPQKKFQPRNGQRSRKRRRVLDL